MNSGPDNPAAAVSPQRNLSRRDRREGSAMAFTLIELLVVISIIGVLAGLIVGLAGTAGRKGKEARVRAELNQLIALIESYHAKFGYYPPDNKNLAGVNINAVTNQLFYELAGVVVNSTGFISPSHGETMTPQAVKDFFNTDGFVNSALKESSIKFKTRFKTSQYGEISENPDIDVLLVPIPWPVNFPNPPVPALAKKGVNPWRYVSSTPTNNPGRFDLWAEFVIGGKRMIISNWSKDTQVID